jgi:cytochrome c oxidase subunit IV
MAAKAEKTVAGYLGVWLLLSVLTVATWWLGTKVQLGAWSVPVALGIAVAKTALVAMFFMHLIEQPGARRVVLPVSMLFMAVLLGVVLLEAATRERMARPDGPKALEPVLPGATRTRYMGD